VTLFRNAGENSCQASAAITMCPPLLQANTLKSKSRNSSNPQKNFYKISFVVSLHCMIRAMELELYNAFALDRPNLSAK